MHVFRWFLFLTKIENGMVIQHWIIDMDDKTKKLLEDIATKLTGIDPIYDKEYQRITYEKQDKKSGRKSSSHRTVIYKSKRRYL